MDKQSRDALVLWVPQSFDEVEVAAGWLFGRNVWRPEFKRICRVTDQTVRRWKDVNRVPGSVSIMLNALIRCEVYGLDLDSITGREKDNAGKVT